MKGPLIVLATTFLAFHSIEAQDCLPDGTCDTHERCPVWKMEGECLRNKKYMGEHCPASCNGVAIPSLQDSCEDAHLHCQRWANLGECSENYEMKRFCAKSCDSCRDAADSDSLCRDDHEHCKFWADKGECESNKGYMSKTCAKSCDACVKPKMGAGEKMKNALLDEAEAFGVRQKVEGEKQRATLFLMKKSVDYMKSEKVTSLSDSIRKSCTNSNELCAFWATIDECESNKAWMKTNCGPSCGSCHLIDMATRCPKLVNQIPALEPGDLNKMFERIVATAPGNQTLTESKVQDLVTQGITEYSVRVLSSPGNEPATEISLENDKSRPPWVIRFDDFLTADECDGLIQLGYDTGYKRSEDVGKQKADGSAGGVQSKGRTSENAWCTERNKCRTDDVPARVHQRMSTVMGIPSENSEDLQLLKYEVGQFYKTHHDYIPHQRDRQCGPRVLTFFIYLSDVEEGGGTDFPSLNITVTPRKGSAILWPSILDSDPLNKDGRTEHQALPVEKGTKFAANGWIHMFDYVGPQSLGCN